MQNKLCLLSLVFGVVCLFASRSEATPYKIEDLIGPIHIEPTSAEGMDSPSGIALFASEMIIYGSHQLMPATQRIALSDTGSPQIYDMEVFRSLEAFAHSEDGDKRGRINDVELIAGELRYFGLSSSPNAVHHPGSYPAEGTIWNQSGEPYGIGFPWTTNRYSDIRASASNGVYVGTVGLSIPIVGAYSQEEISPLYPPDRDSGFTINITSDAKYITGMIDSSAAVWVHDDTGGPLSYQKLELNLEAPPNGMGGGINVRAVDVIDDPYLGNILLGEYANMEVWDWQLAAWQLDTGSLIKTFPVGTTLADTVLIEDTWVIGFNTWNDAGLGTLHDPSLIYLSELPEFQAIQNPNLVGLYAGSLGIFASDPTGMVDFHLASFNPVGYIPPPDDLPEPSTLLMFAMGCLMLGLFRKTLLSPANIKL